MANRLIDELSPYLLQHAHNPVNWYPWGDAAFNEARRLNKPVFLSVGYATCHWCHVMEKESFEDPRAAAALNDTFVCIKVDREERPDIDAVYMAACHMLNNSGGWPLTVLMTPDKKPFFAATYLPKESRLGTIGVVELSRRVKEMVQKSPERIDQGAETITGRLAEVFGFETGDGLPESAVLDQARDLILQSYDSRHGGFDTAPKFPMPHRLLFLMDHCQRTDDDRILKRVTHTLEAMRLGGMWDHVGFGFHRYSTDRQWLLPHFEKMLYDQALLVQAYLRAFQLSRRPLFSQTARELFDYVLRELTSPEGGFYTAQDADSDGEEGKFYLWSQEDFRHALPSEHADMPWERIFSIEPEGNFLEEATRQKTGTNIIHLNRELPLWASELNLEADQLAQRWEQVRTALFRVRARRSAPLLDDKCMTDWNGLMIEALSLGAVVLNDNRYLESAIAAARFVLKHLVDHNGRLLHRYRAGRSGLAATANDYAYFTAGLLGIYKAAGSREWLDYAVALSEQMDDKFKDSRTGGYYLTAADQDDLPVRPKELIDGALPSANAVALHNLIALARLTGEKRWLDASRTHAAAFAATVKRHPTAFCHTLSGWDRLLQFDNPDSGLFEEGKNGHQGSGS